jgi:predicted outer membrane repeat protein
MEGTNSIDGGGGIYKDNLGSLTITGTTFISNTTTDEDGGAILSFFP